MLRPALHSRGVQSMAGRGGETRVQLLGRDEVGVDVADGDGGILLSLLSFLFFFFKPLRYEGRSSCAALTLPSSKTPLFTLSNISFDACKNASSTLCPDFALASTNKSPSSLAHISPSSVDISLGLPLGPSSSHKSILFATNIQVRLGLGLRG